MFEGLLQTANRWLGNQGEENNLPAPAINSSAISAWSYAQTLLKGVGLVAVGGMAYTFFRSSSNTPRSTAEEDALTTANKNAEVNLIQRSKVDHSTRSELQTQSNLPTQTSQDTLDIAYRSKRDVVPITSEIQVNTYTTNDQSSPAIASLLNGEFVITWASNNQVSGTSAQDIYAQRFSSDGAKLGAEILVNTYTTNAQSSPVIAGLSNGEFVITWYSSNQVSGTSDNDIYAQRFSSDGAKLGAEILVNTYTTNAQSSPVIAGLSNGQFVITWASSNQVSGTSSSDIYAQRFAVDGTKLGLEFLVNTYTINLQYQIAITGLADGQFVITWESYNQVSGTSSADIYAQRFADDGTKLGVEFLVNANTPDPQVSTAITGLSNGQFVITWSSYNQVSGTSSYDIYAQRFANDGTKLGPEFLVNTYTISDQVSAAITGLTNGQFVITWGSFNQVSGTSFSDIYAQRFANDGTKLGPEFLVNTYTTNTQASTAITGLSNGPFVLAWQSNNQVSGSSGADIYARVFELQYDLPLLIKNTFSIGQGETVVLESNQLAANTTDISPNDLVFLASNILHGQFAKVSQSSLAIFNFTQGEVQQGAISFTHDDSLTAPSFEITASNGFNNAAPQPAIIDFDKKPIIIFNQFQVLNGKFINLSPSELLATDDRNNTDVFFNVQNVVHGVFAQTSVPLADAFSNPLSMFTQLQVNGSQIRFVHDNSNIAPSYQIQASDGRLLSNYQAGQVNFIANRPPQISRNELILYKGQEKVLDGTSLAATDIDEIDGGDLGKLTFQLSNINHGSFQLTSNAGQSITQFRQSDIANGQVVFKHDGSEAAPSYNVAVSDGIDTSAVQASNVTFSLNPPADQVIRDNTNAAIGGAIGGTGAALLLAGVGIFGAYRYRQNKRLERERAQNPLANALYNALQINGVDDFQSDKGVAFVNAVGALENELARANVDIKQMIPEEIEQLADKLKTAILAKVDYQKGFSGIDLNPLDIQDDAQAIVAIAKSIKATRNVDGDEVELDLMNSESAIGIFNQELRNNGIKLEKLTRDEFNIKVKQVIELFKADTSNNHSTWQHSNRSTQQLGI